MGVDMDLNRMKELDLVPSFLNQEGYDTLSRGYLLNGETVRDAVVRISEIVPSDLRPYVFEAIWKGWLNPASPIWSNAGTKRGLVISCNSIHVDDNTASIFRKNMELAMLTKHGAGVGIYVGDLRSRGTPISGGGKSDGVVPWIKCFEATTNAVSQSGVRRGAAACYLPITHGDYEDFVLIRRNTGDHNLRARNMNIGACVSDNFMNEMLDGNIHYRKLWSETLKERVENGEPYLFFTDTVNNRSPKFYKDQQKHIVTSNICSEITQFTDPEHTFVCCLSSLNVAKYDEWKNYRFGNGMTLPELSTWFLDYVMEEYIQKAKNIEGLECSVRSAVKGRPLGLGVLGFHTYLQDHMIAIDSFEAFMFNGELFSFLDRESLKASKDMAIKLGECEWTSGYGVRNTFRLAVAPTATNSIIAGGSSPGIEPFTTNVFATKSAKGTFIKKNPSLLKLLQEKNLDNESVWNHIIKNNGSVKNLKNLSAEEKEVFLTARELNQHVLIKQTAQRQKFIDQAISTNLFFASNASAKYIHEVHLESWKQGVKTLYYLRSETAASNSTDNLYMGVDSCKACEG